MKVSLDVWTGEGTATWPARHHSSRDLLRWRLGDQGLTPLEHTTNYAVFSSGGMEVHAYAIEELHTLQGQPLYSHDRDEPPRKQLFDRKVIEMLNTMLQGVVLNGTGRAAQLD